MLGEFVKNPGIYPNYNYCDFSSKISTLGLELKVWKFLGIKSSATWTAADRLPDPVFHHMNLVLSFGEFLMEKLKTKKKTFQVDWWYIFDNFILSTLPLKCNFFLNRVGTWDNDQPIVPLGVVFAAFVTAVEWLIAVRCGWPPFNRGWFHSGSSKDHPLITRDLFKDSDLCNDRKP